MAGKNRRQSSDLVAMACGASALVVSVATLLEGTGAVFPGKGAAYYVIALGWGGAILSAALTAISVWALREQSRLSSAYVALVALAGMLVGGTLPISGLLALAFIAALAGLFREKATLFPKERPEAP